MRHGLASLPRRHCQISKAIREEFRLAPPPVARAHRPARVKKECPALLTETKKGPRSPRPIRVHSRPSQQAMGPLHLLLNSLQLLALFLQDRSAAQLDFVALKRQHLHQDLVALLQLVAYFLDTVLGDL